MSNDTRVIKIEIPMCCASSPGADTPANVPGGSEVLLPDMAVQINNEGQFAGSVELTFASMHWMADPDAPVQEDFETTPTNYGEPEPDPVPRVASTLNVGTELGYVSFGRKNKLDPASVIGNAVDNEGKDIAVVIAARPSTLTPDGEYDLRPIENQGTGVKVLAGYSMFESSYNRVNSLGARFDLTPGSTVPLQDANEEGSAGAVKLQGGDISVEYINYGDTTVDRVAEGGHVLINSAHMDENTDLSHGGTIDIHAGGFILDSNGNYKYGAGLHLGSGNPSEDGHLVIDVHGQSLAELGEVDGCKVTFYTNSIRIYEHRTITTPNELGAKGTMCWDSNNIYVCVETNSWKAAPLQEIQPTPV